jgi:histidine triad (HIT) family protein
VPRFEDDGGKPIHAISPSTPNQDDDEMSELAKELSNNIDN